MRINHTESQLGTSRPFAEGTVSFVALLALLFGFSLRIGAQTPDTATLRGQVLDQSRAVVAGVEIKATNTLTGAERAMVTDSQGSFALSGLAAGNYQIAAHKVGFAEAHSELTLVGGSTADIKLQLSVAGGELELTVTGAAGEVRADQPQLGDSLSSTQMQDTPLLNHRISYLPLLNAANRPALNQGDVFMNQNLFTTNGSGRRQTSWVVDGSTGNDSWGRQTIFTNLPLVAVQEMTVLENAFSAEYGATTGGVVNIVTRTGSDRYHGDLFGLWRPSALAAKLSRGATPTMVTSGNQITSDSLGQGAASLSGPIPGTHGTHFFFASEYSRQNRGSPVTSPLAPGVFVGHYTGWLTFLRLDHQLNDANNLFVKANTDSFHDTNPNGTVGGNNLPTVDRIFRRRTYSFEVGETAALTSSVVNNARVQFQLASPITQFDPVIFGTQFQVPIAGAATFTTGTSQSALLLNRQYGVSDTLSTSWGKHLVKFGADVIRAHNGGNSKEFGGPIVLGQLVYNLCRSTVAFCESSAYLNNIANVASYTQSFGNASYTVDDTLWSLFVQDDFRMRPDLTINLGLRYEQQTFTDARKDFAPRVGFAYNWRGDGKTVIRGGFGIYYSQVVDNAAANYALGSPTGIFNFIATAGQIGFPTSVSAVPLPTFPSGALVPVRSLYIRPGRSAFYNQFFPTSVLKGYPNALLNPYSEQWTFGVEHQFGNQWVLSVDYLGAHTLRVLRPLDVDSPVPFIRTTPGMTRSAQAANCTRPLWVKFYTDAGRACPTNPQPTYGLIQSDVNDGFGHYDALNVNLNHRFSRHLTMLASYVYSHAINNVDPDVPGQNPNDPNFTGAQEKGNAIFDQRHRFVLSGTFNAPFGFNIGGVTTLASGLPFNLVTGTTNSGDNGATTDRPVINGSVVPRNAGRGRAIYEFSPFVERDFPIIAERLRIRARAEAFNILNRANFVGYVGTFGNNPTAPSTFGQPATGITNQLPARSMQFSLRLMY